MSTLFDGYAGFDGRGGYHGKGSHGGDQVNIPRLYGNKTLNLSHIGSGLMGSGAKPRTPMDSAASRKDQWQRNLDAYHQSQFEKPYTKFYSNREQRAFSFFKENKRKDQVEDYVLDYQMPHSKVRFSQPY